MGNKKLRALILSLSILAVLALACVAQAYGQNTAYYVTVKSDMLYPLNNATIYIDGAVKASTDTNGFAAIYDYPTGAHNITAVKDGYINKTLPKDIEAGGSADFTLKNQPPAGLPLDDSMVIYVIENNDAKNIVAGASVYVDGQYVGLTDDYNGRVVLNITSGAHEVLASKQDMVNSSKTVDFAKGGNATLLMSDTGRKLSIFDTNLLYNSFVIELTRGALNTIELSVVAFIVGILIGLVMGIGRASPNVVFRGVASVYVECVRGLPLLLQVYFMDYAVPFVYTDVTGKILPSSIYNVFVACVIALSMNSGAYMGEIFKAGIEAIHKGQMEAARSLGMSYNQSMYHVILPQALKIVLPALGNEFIALVKDSSIASIVSYPDILFWEKDIAGESYNSFTPILAAGVIYVSIVLVLGQGVKYMERRLNTNIVKPRERGAGWLGMGRRKKPEPETLEGST